MNKMTARFSYLGCFQRVFVWAAWMLFVIPSLASAGDTLTGVKSRGVLRCGVSEGILGFSQKEDSGRWTGFDVDFCRAVSAAVLGDGKRFLLGLIAIVTPLCAFMPNATTVILLAPIIIRTAKALDVDFVGPMIFMALISNSACLLTLVGDPATLLIGTSIGMTFIEYIKRVSLGAVAALLVLIPLSP
jgi:hypothetical protein